MAGSGQETEETAEQEPPAQVDPSGRWTRTNDILGKGAFKTVYKGFDEQEGIEVAWNQIRMHELVSTKEDRERLFAEIRVLKQLKHKNIMTFYDSWLENKGYTVNFITELFTSGTLRQYRKRHKHMDSEVMKRWAWQILCGLVYLHGHTPPIIHRDLKCDNIFINGSEGVVKIGDLGLATMLRARTAPQSVLGTPEFMAPELYDEEYDDRVDVYSFGMCLLELATLEYPYSECRNAAQIYRKVTLGVRPKALSRVASKELAEFVSYCIQPRGERPRSRQLLKHQYFDSIRAERCSVKLSAEALGLPVPAADGHADLGDYANSAGSSSVSRTSSAAGDLPIESGMALDAVPEEDEESVTLQDFEDARALEQQQEHHNGPSLSVEQQEPEKPAASDHDADTDLRDFKVKGRLQEDEEKLNLRLRIQQPDRAAKVVEFDFDLVSDTAMSVASEMVEEMSLSHNDAHRIALAIKEEIFNLTQKARYADTVSAEHASGHSSDEEAAIRRRALSDSGHAEQAAIAHLEPSAELVNNACSDAGGMSGCEMSVREAVSPQQHFSQPANGPANSSAMTTFTTCSPPDSHFSFGSSPAAEPMLVDAPLLRGPSLTGTSSRKLPWAGLPAGSLKSEGIAQRIGRGEPVNQEDALQQALQWPEGAQNGRLQFAPPKEEDRRLPLKKLLENLQEVDYTASSQGPALSALPSRQDMVATTEGSGSLPALQAASQQAGSVGPTRPQSEVQLRTADAAGLSSPASTSGRQSEASTGVGNPFSHTMQASTASSPRQEAAAGFGIPVVDMQGLDAASKPKESAHAKEARRQAAQTSLKNMESKSLEGLGTFALGNRGCKQLPIKMMSWGKSS